MNILLNNKLKNEGQEYKHKHKENLCFCCNSLHQKNNIKKFRVVNRGYGSKFDGMNFTIQLCHECAKKIDPKWFNNKPVATLGCDQIYEREDLLEKFIDSFSIENQEYIYNEDMDRQDWIELNKEEDEDAREEILWELHTQIRK